MIKKFLTVLFIILIFFSNAALGAVSFFDEFTSINPDIKTNEVIISGKISSFGGETINLMVLRPGVTSVDHSNIGTDVKDIQSALSEPDGSFSFTVKMDMDNDTLGDYTVIVKNKYAANSISGTFYFSDKNAQANAVAAILAADTREKVKQAFSAYYREFGITDTDFGDFQKWGLIYDYVIGNRSYITSIPIFADAFEMASALSGISKSTSQNFIQNLLIYANTLGASLTGDYTLLNQNGLNNLAQYMTKAELIPYRTKEAFSAAFAEGAGLSALSTAGSWKELYDIAVKYKNEIGIDLSGSGFSALGDNGIALLKEMLDIKYNSFGDFKTKYEALYPSYLPKAPSGNNSSNSGSGGGGGNYPIKYDPDTKPIEDGKENYFDDLDGFDWALDSVNKLYERNVISGKGGKIFDPAGNVTRAEFIKMIMGAYSISILEGDCPFTDVSKGDWFYSYTSAAYNLGIVTGSDGLFYPNDSITREQMFTILKRVFDSLGRKLPIKRENNIFSDDADISDYAREAAEGLYKAEIVSGAPENRLNPKSNASRAEAAVLILRAMSVN